MKLLFDQNLSPRLARELAALCPGSIHVRDFGLERANDDAIWDFAAREGFTIVTKDDDFRQRSFVQGAPPKIVWVSLGNSATADVAALLGARLKDIEAFREDPVASLLVLRKAAILPADPHP